MADKRKPIFPLENIKYIYLKELHFLYQTEQWSKIINFFFIDFCCPKRRYSCVYKSGSRTGADPSGGISFNIFYFLGEFHKNYNPWSPLFVIGWLIG